MKKVLERIKNLFQKAEEVAPAAVQIEEQEENSLETYTLEDGYTTLVLADQTEEEKRIEAEIDRDIDISSGKWGMGGAFSVCGTFRDMLEDMRDRKEWEAREKAEAEAERQHVAALKKRIAELEKGELTGDAYREWNRLMWELCAWE